MLTLSTTIRYSRDALLAGITIMLLGSQILPRLGYGDETVLNVLGIKGGLLLLSGVAAVVIGNR